MTESEEFIDIDITDVSKLEELDGVKKREGKYCVVNRTGTDLIEIRVYHKYSDNYRNTKIWKNIPDGTTTPAAPATYNTGFGTTGRDWWLVTWLDKAGNLYMTNPKNGRAFFDGLEKVGKGMLEGIREMVKNSNPKSSEEAAALTIGAVCDAVFSPMLNSEATAGFKQHILRAEDEGHTTKIIIEKKEVVFDSKSGKSTTGFKQCDLSEIKKYAF